MERIILYPNTPEFELFEKLKKETERHLLLSFTAGFKAGQLIKYQYSDKEIKTLYKKLNT